MGKKTELGKLIKMCVFVHSTTTHYSFEHIESSNVVWSAKDILQMTKAQQITSKMVVTLSMNDPSYFCTLTNQGSIHQPNFAQ